MQYPSTFEKMIENGIKIKEAMVKKGVLKLFKGGANSFNNTNKNNDKPKFWNRNRNILNGGLVDTNNLKQKQPIFNLPGYIAVVN